MGIMECMQGELWLGNEPSSISFTNPETPDCLGISIGRAEWGVGAGRTEQTRLPGRR